MFWVLILSLSVSVITLLAAFFRARWIYKQPVKGESLKKTAGYIASGAMTFLKDEYRLLLPYMVVVALLLFVGNRGALKAQSLSFLTGAFCSGLAGYIGMKVATASNSRTTTAADTSLKKALKVAFFGGSVMGLTVAGLALMGICLVIMTSVRFLGGDYTSLRDTVFPVLTGFSLGASSVALFARVGGGIYTKAADVGADLVGKIEKGIPEDDPRNPAVIADNVGDNVGDVAGMGADLFESFVGSIIGTMILGISSAVSESVQMKMAFFPLLLVGLGCLTSLLGMVFVGLGKGHPQRSLNQGTLGAAFITALLVFPLSRALFGNESVYNDHGALHLFMASVLGLFSGVVIGLFTEFFTGKGTRPVKKIVRSCKTGTATNLITGLGVGMFSTVVPVLIIASAVLGCFYLGGFYGVGIGAVSMLMTLSIQLAVDAYGPVADNAGGLAVMAGFSPEVRSRTDELDAVGNTTAAIGKGFAIGSAALTSIILFASFLKASGLNEVNLMNVFVLTGILIGCMIPYVFSALSMDAVGKAAYAMIEEVRAQFHRNPGILTGDEIPDYTECVDISTRAALSRMILPGLIAVITPVLVGFLGGREMLAGLLVGVTSSGVLMATFMVNAGGAWDNAKKMLEADEEVDKSSDAYKASVVGDTVGDPFKDTAGPSLNILIKLMAVISLVIAPMLGAL